MSPPPDFESGASTNSATPAQAVIIAKIACETMGKLNLFAMLVIYIRDHSKTNTSFVNESAKAIVKNNTIL